ncbi:hypothetical protein [Methylosinus sp. Ce-a6]|uniref:hypothetical protein n=1 Tax=Methylosinus sp. Ce-a6 TaxID=2172005 RepID=UPI00135CCDBB|nr:hypothetical protein [Methylosinus sp. Ce-a6]
MDPASFEQRPAFAPASRFSEIVLRLSWPATSLGLVGKGNERDRRPTQHGIDRIIARADLTPQLLIPLGRIVRFAIATAMRLDEICRVAWDDFGLSAMRARSVGSVESWMP